MSSSLSTNYWPSHANRRVCPGRGPPNGGRTPPSLDDHDVMIVAAVGHRKLAVNYLFMVKVLNK